MRGPSPAEPVAVLPAGRRPAECFWGCSCRPVGSQRGVLPAVHLVWWPLDAVTGLNTTAGHRPAGRTATGSAGHGPATTSGLHLTADQRQGQPFPPGHPGEIPAARSVAIRRPMQRGGCSFDLGCCGACVAVGWCRSSPPAARTAASRWRLRRRWRVPSQTGRRGGPTRRTIHTSKERTSRLHRRATKKDQAATPRHRRTPLRASAIRSAPGPPCSPPQSYCPPEWRPE